MLDIKFIRENSDIVKQAITDKQIELDLDAFLGIDQQRREFLQQHESLRAQQNEASDKIASASNEEKQQIIADMKVVADKAHEIKDKLQQIESEFNKLMLLIPQIPISDAPRGGEEANKVTKEVGAPTVFDFEAKDHIQLGESLDMIDIERGVKLMGTRGYILKNEGARLQRALMSYALDFLMERGFTQLVTPVLAKKEFFTGTGHFPFAEDETFRVFDQRKDQTEAPLYLVGTSEIPLCGYHAGETLLMADLPVQYTAETNCFRTEVGSYGKDTAGLYRIKQFTKVEQVVLMKADEQKGREALQLILKNAEDFLTSLEIPYRLLQIATGDMGAGKVEMYDIESWMPSRDAYGETHSASYLGDWQARRLNIKYEDADGKKQFVHTLNNTLVASPRILIPLLENHQRADGSINIPQALRPYMNNQAEIKLK
jgi:seryl-tRNA synthetase